MIILTVAGLAQAQAPTPKALDAVAFDQNLDAQVPMALTFKDDLNRRVRLDDLVDDRPTVLALVQYRCPMLCTLVLNGLVDCLRDVTLDPGEDFNVVVVSIDPRETPMLALDKKRHLLQKFARPKGDDGWRLLVSEEPTIRALADAIGFRYAYDADTDQYAHPSGIVVLTPGGRVSQYFLGMDYPPARVQQSLTQAARNNVGSPVANLLLRCFHYDPQTGRFTLTVMSAVRIGGVVTCLGMATMIVVMARRRRSMDQTQEPGA